MVRMERPQPTSRRKKIRLNALAYCCRNAVLSVTICCYRRMALLESQSLSARMAEPMCPWWELQGFEVLAFALMPDHAHLLIRVEAGDLVRGVGSWKRQTTFWYREGGGHGLLWQRSFYDHALRRDEDLATVAHYIASNPMRTNRPDRARFVWHAWMQGEQGRGQGPSPTV